jgi:hypothetical protein
MKLYVMLGKRLKVSDVPWNAGPIPEKEYGEPATVALESAEAGYNALQEEGDMKAIKDLIVACDYWPGSTTGAGHFVISTKNFGKYQLSLDGAPVCKKLVTSHGGLPRKVHAELMVSILGEQLIKHGLKDTDEVLPKGTVLEVFGRFGLEKYRTNKDERKRNLRRLNPCYQEKKDTGPDAVTCDTWMYQLSVLNSGRKDVYVPYPKEASQGSAKPQGESSIGGSYHGQQGYSN